MMEDIEDFFVEEHEIIQSAIQRKQEQITNELMKNKYFLTRYATVQGYFMYMSWPNKRKFMTELLKRLRKLQSILQILHVMSSRAHKCISYDFVDPNSGYIPDKLMLDHNRMLDKSVLEKTVLDDLDWFTTLNDASQVTVLIGLLRLSAGVAKRAMHFPIWRRYYELIKEMEPIIGSDVTEVTATGDFICYKKVGDDFEGIEFDHKHHANIEVEKQQKQWDDMIEKYKADVHEAIRKLQSKSTAGVTNKAKKQNADKDSKTKKEKDRKKGQKKKRRGSKRTTKAVQVRNNAEMDAIQLMPIWIVKRIFSFLDAKSLHNCKKVNKYWNYVVQEIMKESKTRQQLNAQLETIESSIGKQKIEELKRRLRNKTVYPEKRKNDIMHYDFGAIASKLIPKTKIYLEETSLVEKAFKEMPDEFGENRSLVTFPRLIKSDMAMYKFKSCFLKDVNIQPFIDQDIERQKSLLTYSLETIMDSFKITVEQNVLEDW